MKKLTYFLAGCMLLGMLGSGCKKKYSSLKDIRPYSYGEYSTPEKAFRSFVEAYIAKDTSTLKKLIESPEPDKWEMMFEESLYTETKKEFKNICSIKIERKLIEKDGTLIPVSYVAITPTYGKNMRIDFKKEGNGYILTSDSQESLFELEEKRLEKAEEALRKIEKKFEETKKRILGE